MSHLVSYIVNSFSTRPLLVLRGCLCMNMKRVFTRSKTMLLSVYTIVWNAKFISNIVKPITIKSSHQRKIKTQNSSSRTMSFNKKCEEIKILVKMGVAPIRIQTIYVTNYSTRTYTTFCRAQFKSLKKKRNIHNNKTCNSILFNKKFQIIETGMS